MGREPWIKVRASRPCTRLGKGRRVVYAWWRNYRAMVVYRGRWKHPLPTVWHIMLDGELVSFDSVYPGGPMPKAFQDGAGEITPLKGAEKGVLSKQHPTLWSWVCDAVYDDNRPMGQTVLSLRRQGTVIVASLRIADQGGLKVEVVDSSPERALGALEAVLSNPAVPWQPDYYPLQGGARKGRKK